MNCKKCGFLLAENEQYCRNCGALVNANNSQTINTGIQQDMTQNVNNQNISNSGVGNDNLNSQQIQNNNLINNEVGQSATIGLTPNTNNISQIEQLNIQDIQNNVNPSMSQQSIQNNNLADNSMNQNMYTQPLNPNDYGNHNFGSNSNQELIDAYIGDKADIIKNKDFSFATLFFGPIYFLYRKMSKQAKWLFGIEMLVCTIIAFIPLSPQILSIIMGLVVIAVDSVAAIMFKKLYLHDVESKVNKIKIKNTGISHGELLEICRKKGGAWKSVIVIYIVISILFPIALFFIWLGMMTSYYGFKNDTNDSYPSINNNSNNYNNESLNVANTTWIASGGSEVIFTNNRIDWYKSPSDHNDNIQSGTYKLYTGSDAIKYITEDLSEYGITKYELDRLFNEDEQKISNFVVFDIRYDKFILDGQAQNIERPLVPWYGFISNNRTQLNVVNMNTGSNYIFTKK